MKAVLNSILHIVSLKETLKNVCFLFVLSISPYLHFQSSNSEFFVLKVELNFTWGGGGGVVPIGYQDIVVRGYDDIIFAPKQLMVPPVLGLGLELGLTLTLPPLRWHTIGIKLFHSLIHQRRIGTHCKQETLCRS